MNILLWIVFGGLAGWLASEVILSGGEDGLGVIANVVVGVVGAFVGGWVNRLLGGSSDAERPSSVQGFLLAVVGAVVVLVLVNLLFGSV